MLCCMKCIRCNSAVVSCMCVNYNIMGPGSLYISNQPIRIGDFPKILMKMTQLIRVERTRETLIIAGFITCKLIVL